MFKHAKPAFALAGIAAGLVVLLAVFGPAIAKKGRT